MVNISYSQYRGHGLIPSWGTKTLQATQCSLKKTKEQKTTTTKKPASYQNKNRRGIPEPDKKYETPTADHTE